jgi:hypothetical protein
MGEIRKSPFKLLNGNSAANGLVKQRAMDLRRVKNGRGYEFGSKSV